MLDARRMQVLRAVVSGGSISSAATNLGYTPSAISQQVATLEREAGTALLEKVGRGVRPTAAGRLLAERAAELAGLLADTDAELDDLRAGRTGRLRLRYFGSAGVGLIPPVVAKFRAEHPEVRLDLKMIDEGILGEVATGEADLAVIVVGRELPQARGVRVEHLVDEPYHVLLPQGHPLSQEPEIDLARLAGEPWVLEALGDGPCAESLRDAFDSAGFAPRIELETGGDYAAQAFVAAGLGIGLQPRLALGVLHPGIVVRPVRRPEPVRRIHVAVRETVADQPATRSLLAALRDTARA
ncbi:MULTISPECIES: LysR family transcriptional regulator [unclassified Saccharopolyspora]|uniref:LysR family transcriptional regulator n=1 Tax=unclassified Saccharopolyspora TaxID=2646250 RepID=UPI001CD3CC76|nr:MULTISPECIES: LysR family transcriptional regulator [unclassified Saccharopolyspora]MCA1190033.1 LysR family transcriptional regulator [Saccharopolyspora sp. 6T]MCA1281624.1 LysR family transcriptional regulator [Saccharopolyspora sp. 7B]